MAVCVGKAYVMISPFEYEHDSWIIYPRLMTHGIFCVAYVCVYMYVTMCVCEMLPVLWKTFGTNTVGGLQSSPGRERWHRLSSVIYVCVSRNIPAGCTSIYTYMHGYYNDLVDGSILWGEVS